MEKWMTKQAIRCLRRGDDDRVSWFQQRTWEPFKRRRLYDKQIDRASEELGKLIRWTRGTLDSLEDKMLSLSGWVYIPWEKQRLK